jgi:hypothetical protein
MQKLQRQMAALDAKLDIIAKVTSYGNGEYEVEFAKETTSEGEDDGGVPYQGKPRRGDWPPGSDTPGSGRKPPKGTRANDYVSDDESNEHGGEMTPELASEVLQPYADHSVPPEEDNPKTESDELYSRLEDEDEEAEDEQVGKAVDALALRLAKRFPRASVAAIANTVDGALDGASSSRSRFGREREYAKRAAVAQRQPIRKGHTDSDLFERMQKRFPRVVGGAYLINEMVSVPCRHGGNAFERSSWHAAALHLRSDSRNTVPTSNATQKASLPTRAKAAVVVAARICRQQPVSVTSLSMR